MTSYHEPVMVSEVMSYLLGSRREILVDCTAGDGGHTLQVLKRTRDTYVLALDVDKDAVSTVERRLGREYSGRFRVQKGDYRELGQVLGKVGIPRVDGCLFDLGVSSRQVDTLERGFTYWGNAPLDMRMNQDSPVTARDLLWTLSQDQLAKILWEYGEERFSREIAARIVSAREVGEMNTAEDLVKVIKAAIPLRARQGDTHPARRTFQALRIATNDEISRLGRSLREAFSLTRPGGAIVVLSYHSLEDRIVKSVFREIEDKGLGKRLTKKPVRPTEAEVNSNPRARSAKLRAVERTIRSRSTEGIRQ